MLQLYVLIFHWQAERLEPLRSRQQSAGRGSPVILVQALSRPACAWSRWPSATSQSTLTFHMHVTVRVC